MTQEPTGPAGLPQPVLAAAHQAAELLYAALGAHMSEHSRPEIAALWRTAKLLSAAAGDLDTPGLPTDEQRRQRWEEVAANAAYVADQALIVVGDGLDLAQAQGRLLDADVREQDVADCARAYGGVIELTPPDFEHTERTPTVAISSGRHRTLSVTADRGEIPQPREHTAATLLRTAHHLHQLGQALGEAVLEPIPYGIPMCGRPDHQVTCQICQRTVGADIARTIDVYKPSQRTLTVCSTTCARAADAGEYTDPD